MMDWLAKMLGLPKQFLSGGKGGGVIQVINTNLLFRTLTPFLRAAAYCYRDKSFLTCTNYRDKRLIRRYCCYKVNG